MYSTTAGTARKPNRRTITTAGAGGLMAATLLLLTGCTTGAEDDWNSTAVGDDKSVGEVDLRSVLLVTHAEGEAARILGTLENNGGRAVEVTISDDDETTVLTVPAQGSVPLDTVETLLRTAGDAPGARTSLTAATDAGDVDLLVPVVDGTLDPYQPYLPDGALADR